MEQSRPLDQTTRRLTDQTACSSVTTTKRSCEMASDYTVGDLVAEFLTHAA